MKPRPTPCFFWNVSLYLARSSITRDMSASLNVVRMAAPCWAASSRSAIRARMGLIRCLVSRAPSVGACACGCAPLVSAPAVTCSSWAVPPDTAATVWPRLLLMSYARATPAAAVRPTVRQRVPMKSLSLRRSIASNPVGRRGSVTCSSWRSKAPTWKDGAGSPEIAIWRPQGRSAADRSSRQETAAAAAGGRRWRARPAGVGQGALVTG